MAAVDPSTYTAGGANSSVIATNSTTVTITSMRNSHEAYLSKDYGVGDFGNFQIQSTFNVSAGSASPIYYPIGFANTVGDFTDLETADDGIVVLAITLLGFTSLRITDLASGVSSPLSDGFANGTNQYLTFERVGSTATLTIRTGSHGGTVFDAVTSTVSTDAFQYNFLTQSSGTSGSSNVSYTLTDIDIDEVIPPVTFNPAWASQRSRMINPGLN